VPWLVFLALVGDVLDKTPETAVSYVLLAITVVFAFVWPFLLTASVVSGVLSNMRGQPVRIKDSLRNALPVLLPTIALAIIESIAIVFGFMIVIVPGVIILCMLMLSVPALVAERPGIFKSMTRSMTLTNGFRWKIFAVVLLTVIISMIFNFVVIMVYKLIPMTETLPYQNSFIKVITDQFSVLFVAIVTTVAYHDIRVVKEGTHIDEMARIFA